MPRFLRPSVSGGNNNDAAKPSRHVAVPSNAPVAAVPRALGAQRLRGSRRALWPPTPHPRPNRSARRRQQMPTEIPSSMLRKKLVHPQAALVQSPPPTLLQAVMTRTAMPHRLRVLEKTPREDQRPHHGYGRARESWPSSPSVEERSSSSTTSRTMLPRLPARRQQPPQARPPAAHQRPRGKPRHRHPYRVSSSNSPFRRHRKEASPKPPPSLRRHRLPRRRQPPNRPRRNRRHPNPQPPNRRRPSLRLRRRPKNPRRPQRQRRRHRPRLQLRTAPLARPQRRKRRRKTFRHKMQVTVVAKGAVNRP